MDVMNGTVGFLYAAPYEERIVDCYSNAEERLTVSTVAVNDSPKKYETAVQHPLYNEEKWVVVGGYDTKEEAQVGHDLWVKEMTTGSLPDELINVSESVSAKMLDEISGSEGWRIHKLEL